MTRLSRREFLRSSLALIGSYPAVLAGETNVQEAAFYPSCIKLYTSGVLRKRVETLCAIYENCHLCPRDCRVDRTNGQKGKCQAPATVKVSSAVPHFGEEAPLVGKRGSGTIFFSHCGLRCLYCQNYTISLEGEGVEISDRRLAEAMLKLQRMGCHNINLVTPTHYVPSIVRALEMAIPMGLRIPLVYNTGGFERVDILELLEDIIDIYLPDCKYMDPEMAAKYSEGAYSYPYYAKLALKEMYRQVGDLKTRRGIAQRGLIIRHLVLPNRISGTKEFLEFVAKNFSSKTAVNIMRQYRPEYKAFEYPELARRITAKEYREAIAWARELGLQPMER